MDILLDIVTGAVAVATCGLAFFTARLATATSDAIKQTDQHHQDDNRPYLFLDFQEPSRQAPFGKWSKPSMIIREVQNNREALPPPPPIRIRGQLSNRGGGLGLEVVAYFNTGTSVKYEDGKPYEVLNSAARLTGAKAICGGIRAGETITCDVCFEPNDAMQIDAGNGPRAPFLMQLIESDCHEFVLEYRDRFKNVFRTVYRIGYPNDIGNHIFDSVDKKLAYASNMHRPDIPAPIFFKGQQSRIAITDLNPQPHLREFLRADEDQSNQL